MKRYYQKIIEYMNKKNYMPIIYYGVFGVLTTIINLAIYKLLVIFGVNYIVSATFAWIFAVSLAYLTNRKLVFKSIAKQKHEIFEEVVKFFMGRVATYFIDIIGLFVMVQFFNIDDFISKLFMNLVVIITNFFFSKLAIMSKKKGKEVYE